MIKRFFRWLRGLFRREDGPMVESRNCLDCQYGELDPWVWPCLSCICSSETEAMFPKWTPKNRHFIVKEV